MKVRKDVGDAEINLFQNNNKWILQTAGFGESRKAGYVLYIIFVFAIVLYGLIMAVWAVAIVIPDKILIVLAAHIILVSVFASVMLASRIITERSINLTNRMIIAGIYNYEDEEIDEHQSNMKEEIDKEIRRTCDLMVLVFGSGSISNFVVFPLTQLMFYDDSLDRSILNPYLPPFFFYMPFNTRTPGGYCLAFCLTALLAASIYAIAIGFMLIYFQCSVHLKGQLKILNYSLKNLHRRALSKYKKERLINDCSPDKLLGEIGFQTCLHSCFKANVKHHQALLRFKTYLQPFNGACLFDCYIMIALIYAALFYMILQNLPITFLINFVEMLFSEQCGLFLICLLGETITEESGKLFETLYDIEWTGCNKKVTNSCRIMMSNTLKPLYIKALFIDSKASLASYGEFMMGMYKIMNLMRQSDAVR